MRALLSTIGSRGDVQPLVALALELRALGQQVQ
jgi:vancomycin aglycone glucosyltransferase